MDGPERRAEKRVRGADEDAGTVLRKLEELGRLLQRGGHRLLDEHVPAGLERGLRERPVLVHARQHEDDVGGLDDVLGAAEVSIDVVVRGRAVPLGSVDVVHRADVDAAGGAEPADHGPVRACEDAPAADHAEPEAHAVRLATR